MALVPIRITRTTRPPVGTSIDWINPLTRSLVGAWAFNEGVGKSVLNSVTGKNTALGVTQTLTPSGVKTSSSGVVSESFLLGSDFTIFSSQTETSLGGCLIGLSSASGLRWMSSESGFRFLNRKISGTTVADFSVAGPVINQPYTAAAVFSNLAGGSIWKNGTLLASNAAVGADTSATWVAYLCAGASSSRALSGIGTLAVLFNRALSAAEIASLSANPWQIYEPEIMWVSVAIGTPGITGNLSASLAEWNLSATGKIAISGQSNQMASLAGSHAGTILTTGQALQSLAAMSGSQSGIVAIIGNQSALISLEQSATGIIGTPAITGSMSALLADLAGASSGRLSISGAHIETTIMAGTGAGTMPIHGMASQVMALTQIASGKNSRSPVVILLVNIHTPSAEQRIHQLSAEQNITNLYSEQRIYRLPEGHA